MAGIFLFDLDLKIKNSFLRYNDDYLIFCKNRKDSELILKNLIIPELKELNLEINHKKLKSDRFHKNKMSFIGFNFYGGHFIIKKEKIENFKKN